MTNTDQAHKMARMAQPRCGCGNVAVEYNTGYRCQHCKEREEAMQVSDITPEERARRARLAQGYSEYSVALPGHRMFS